MKLLLPLLILVSCITSPTVPIAEESACANDLVQAAIQRTSKDVRYDPAYVTLDYPNGDVPANTGVCTDVVIRSYRQLGFDFQKAIHEDMKQHFTEYPQRWGLSRPDKNIDHRRVPNIMYYLKSHGHQVTDEVETGDLLCWDLGGGITHIGIVVDVSNGVQIVHNIGSGPEKESEYEGMNRIGHYRFCP
ncbi:MAG: DUF1287 domain-containing protein [Bacteroidota bacterium]